MKNQKKIKLGKLNFFVIDDNYIKYLSQFDKHIAYNKSEKRPYIGVIIIKVKMIIVKFYKDLSCNFKLLEEKCSEYKYESEK